MFAARGIAVSLSVFVMVYCVLSLAVCLCWRMVWLHSQRHIQFGALRICCLLCECFRWPQRR